uniref:Uncharacterized protein n=1 Tax=Arion vulgaris TaxID=1028688 RepID=A0A0B6ZLC8_9EUPU
MVVWQDRRLTYKMGFIGVTLGVLMFIVGFCAPSWAQYSVPSRDDLFTMGLWQKCTVGMGVCTLSIDTDSPGWLKAVRALMCISILFAVAACIIGLYCNCILKVQLSSAFFNKNMETSAMVSVVFCAFGLIIFATQVHTYSGQIGHVFWGFILVCVSNAVIGISSFLMLISHRLNMMAAQDHFAHRQFSESFNGNVHLPDYSCDGGSQMFITTPEGYTDYGPPAYETVVNCIPQDEVAPPPYSQVVKSDK